MAADIIRLTYTSSTNDIYVLDIDRFLDEEIPRRIIGEAELERTILGMSYSRGPSVKHRNLWVINTMVENRVTAKATLNSVNYNEVILLKQMYDAWDTDRANGLVALVNIVDNVLEPSSPYMASGWFTEPPALSVVGSYGSKAINAVFSLTEVP